MNHGCDSGSSSSYGCELLRKLIYDARHELRELYERWEHRLTPYNFLSVAEQYVKGRLTVALDVDFPGPPVTLKEQSISLLPFSSIAFTPLRATTDRTGTSNRCLSAMSRWCSVYSGSPFPPW